MDLKGPAWVIPVDERKIWFVVKIGNIKIGPDTYKNQELAQVFADEVNREIEKSLVGD